jgi:tRNA dimethylallyltransferase
MQLPVKKPLIILTGPTAVGKTQLSLDIVESLHGEIISADSRLFYRGLDIGTAKPTKKEREIVPHHLIDIAAPDETMSLAVFQQSVYRISQELWAKGKVPFLVGGTGQFVRAIMEGWQIPPQEPDIRLRQVIEEWGAEIGPDALHTRLQIIDNAAAQKIEPSNLRRTVRALEVIFSTGELFSSQRKRKKRGFQYKVIGLYRDRAELYERIDERITQMFTDGFLDEVRALLDTGYDADLPSLSAIGYKEVIAHLQGKIDMDEVIKLMKRRTRAYVRRQANWFKQDDPRIRWFEMDDALESKIIDYIISAKEWKNG